MVRSGNGRCLISSLRWVSASSPRIPSVGCPPLQRRPSRAARTDRLSSFTSLLSRGRSRISPRPGVTPQEKKLEF
ncbi:Zinc finger protein 268 [Manis javanica]|nr:Zinc finger protein 268 [Manis javanica]